MLNAMPELMTTICFVLSVLSLSVSCLLIVNTVRHGSLEHMGIYLARDIAGFCFYVLWCLFLGLAAADLTFDRTTTIILRWATLIYPALCLLLALTEHEWTLLLPGLFAVLTVPFFETAFGSIFPYELTAMLVVLLAETLIRLVRHIQKAAWALDLRSIQEAVDSLDDGLLFADEAGRILLSNRTMDALSTSLCRQDLTNAARFWKTLEESDSTDFITKVSSDNSFLFRFTGGNTWTLYREEFLMKKQKYVQIVALNITDSDHVQRQIILRRAELSRTAEQLQQVENTIERLKNEEAKVERGRETFESITDKMASLSRFFTEHYALPAETFDYKRLAGLTAGLLQDLEHAPALTAVQQLDLTVSAFSLLGIAVKVNGRLPEGEAASVFLAAIREASVNAVIHGNATSISVELDSGEGELQCRISNNGILPEGAINPGSGITGIRRLLFPLNGQLEITREPEFSLLVKIPVKKE